MSLVSLASDLRADNTVPLGSDIASRLTELSGRSLDVQERGEACHERCHAEEERFRVPPSDPCAERGHAFDRRDGVEAAGGRLEARR